MIFKMDDDKSRLKRKRSESYRNNSLECLPVSKIFKKDYNSHKKRFIANGNKKKYNNDTFASDKSKIVYPDHYCFGGNLTDPLNLNGLMNSGDISHSVTPLHSPPVTSPHRHDVLVPVAHAVNIYDPLNLCGEEGDDLFFKRRNRIRKRRHSTKKRRSKSRLNSLSDEATEGNLSTSSETKVTENVCSLKKDYTLLNDSQTNILPHVTANYEDKNNIPNKTEVEVFKTLDCIKRGNSRTESLTCTTKRPSGDTKLYITSSQSKNLPPSTQMKSKRLRYIHGNYNTHGGYMNSDYIDARLEALPRQAFKGKEVLDVGCNVGHSSIMIALYFGVKHITGIDLDDRLVKAAKKNLLYHAGLHERALTSFHSNNPHKSTHSPTKPNCNPFKLGLSPVKSNPNSFHSFKSNNTVPSHLRSSYGTIINHPLLNLNLPDPSSSTQATSAPHQLFHKPSHHDFNAFPHNVSFIQEDYAPLSNLEVQHQTPQYDVILALALTKHIHLNHGDQGLQLLFQKVHRQLRPGGRFIMQAQQWSSYNKHIRTSDRLTRNYNSIKFFPTQFEQYLLSEHVGFVKCNHIADIRLPHKTKACQQFILEFIKGPSSSIPAPAAVATTASDSSYALNAATTTTTTSSLDYLPSTDVLSDLVRGGRSEVLSTTSIVSNVDSTSLLHTLDGVSNRTADDDEDDVVAVNNAAAADDAFAASQHGAVQLSVERKERNSGISAGKEKEGGDSVSFGKAEEGSGGSGIGKVERYVESSLGHDDDGADSPALTSS